MFNRKSKNDDTISLQTTIDAAFIELSGYSAEDDEYDAILGKIERLNKLKDPNQSRKPISYDTLIAAGANLLGIGLILSYEHIAPITSKALGFVAKTKI